MPFKNSVAQSIAVALIDTGLAEQIAQQISLKGSPGILSFTKLQLSPGDANNSSAFFAKVYPEYNYIRLICGTGPGDLTVNTTANYGQDVTLGEPVRSSIFIQSGMRGVIDIPNTGFTKSYDGISLDVNNNPYDIRYAVAYGVKGEILTAPRAAVYDPNGLGNDPYSPSHTQTFSGTGAQQIRIGTRSYQPKVSIVGGYAGTGTFNVSLNSPNGGVFGTANASNNAIPEVRYDYAVPGAVIRLQMTIPTTVSKYWFTIRYSV